MLDDIRTQLQASGTVTFVIRVKPGAARNRIAGTMSDGTLKLDVRAIPEDGKANEAVIRLMAEYLGVSATQITLVSGATSRRKMLTVRASVQSSRADPRTPAARPTGRRRE